MRCDRGDFLEYSQLRRRLSEIEKKAAADVLLEEKVARIDRAVEAFTRAGRELGVI